MKKNLNGYGKQFKGNHNDEPTEKQQNILKKLRAYYGVNKIPECKTKGDAWNLINKYQHVIKYDKVMNEFYIEDNIVNNKTCYRLINEDEYECMKLVKQIRDLLTEKELEDYEEMISYIGDYSIIKEVSQYMIEQRIKAEEAKAKAEEEAYWKEVEEAEEKYWEQERRDYLNKYDPGDDFEEDWIRSLE